MDNSLRVYIKIEASARGGACVLLERNSERTFLEGGGAFNCIIPNVYMRGIFMSRGRRLIEEKSGGQGKNKNIPG